MLHQSQNQKNYKTFTSSVFNDIRKKFVYKNKEKNNVQSSFELFCVLYIHFFFSYYFFNFLYVFSSKFAVPCHPLSKGKSYSFMELTIVLYIQHILKKFHLRGLVYLRLLMSEEVSFLFINLIKINLKYIFLRDNFFLLIIC